MPQGSGGGPSHRVNSRIVGLFLASTCYAGVDSSPATPLLVDFMVDKLGRAVRSIEMRAVAPEPLVTWEIRRFPAAGTDGDASRIPHLIDFDLNIQPVYVIR
jgi:hypothetical protein